jgi:stress-induced morphogen
MSTSKDEEFTATQNATGVTAEILKDKLEKELEATHVEIQDLSGSSAQQYSHHCEEHTLMARWIGGCGQMFEAIIVSPKFEKKMTLARHRLVNGLLKQEIAAIHAWTPKCFTPEEWDKKKSAWRKCLQSAICGYAGFGT